jgi:nicotinamide-nucleotide adenylyltransferase
MRMKGKLEDEKEISELLAGLDPNGPPRLAYVRKAPVGIPEEGGNLLCLSASFNPLTTAHLWLIQEASRLVPPDEVLLVLAKANVDKGAAGFPLERRLLLLRRFAEARLNFSVAATHHGRFVDKVEAIRQHYPETTRLTFSLGLDTLVRLFDAKYYSDRQAELAALFGKGDFIAANRAPEPPEAVLSFLGRPEVAPYAARIQVIHLPADIAAISATEVRARLARGEPATGIVPPEILPLLSSAQMG